MAKAPEALPLDAGAAVECGGDMPTPHRQIGLGGISLSVIKTIRRLLQLEGQASPRRWRWICNLAEHLKVGFEGIDLRVMQVMTAQAAVLEERLVEPQLAAAGGVFASRAALEQPRRAKKTLFEHTAEPAEDGRAKRLRTLRECPPSPQPPLRLTRDNLLRSHVGP